MRPHPAHALLERVALCLPIRGRRCAAGQPRQDVGRRPDGSLLDLGLGSRPLLVAVGNVLGRAKSADLPRVQRRSSGPVHPVRAIHLADREQVPDVDRFPPDVAGQPAVVVLGADGNLERLGGDLDAVLAVQVDGPRVQLPQPLDRASPTMLGSGSGTRALRGSDLRTRTPLDCAGSPGTRAGPCMTVSMYTRMSIREEPPTTLRTSKGH